MVTRFSFCVVGLWLAKIIDSSSVERKITPIVSGDILEERLMDDSIVLPTLQKRSINILFKLIHSDLRLRQ